MSDTVRVKGLVLEGRIGVFESEKQNAQRYSIDVEVRLDLSPAGKSDSLEDTVDYSELCERAASVMERCSGRNLIESFAEELAAEILEAHGSVIEVRIRVEKPDVQLAGHQFEALGIEIVRGRK